MLNGLSRSVAHESIRIRAILAQRVGVIGLTSVTANLLTVWMLPLMLCVMTLNNRHYDQAALSFGLTVAIKQQPWLLIPFIAVWLWYESRELEPANRNNRRSGGIPKIFANSIRPKLGRSRNTSN